MQRIFSVKLCTLVVVGLISSKATEELNDQDFYCDLSRNVQCKDANSKFEMCPNSSRLYKSFDSKISLNESRLYIYDYGALYVLRGGSFLLNHNGLCKIFGNSFLEIDKNAITTVEKGTLVLSESGEISNMGSVYVGQNSVLEVNQQARILLEKGESDAVGGSIHVDDSAIVYISRYSKVTVKANSELRAISNNKINIESHSTFDLADNAELLMANGSNLELPGKASLSIGSEYCSRHNRTRFLLGSGSDVRVNDHSTIKLEAGQIKVDDRASLWVFGLSILKVCGLLHIKDEVSVTINNGNRMEIGGLVSMLGGQSSCEYCSSSASLIITNGNAIPRELYIYQGAHCFTKKSAEFSHNFFTKATVWLQHYSETKEFKCFNSRDKLMAAVNGI